MKQGTKEGRGKSIGGYLCNLFVACVLCSTLAIAGCVTDPATGKQSIDTSKVSTYITYARAFNVGLSMAADIAATVSPTPQVQAGVVVAKAAIAVANAALDKLEASMKTATSAAQLEEEMATAQGAVEAANAATGVVTAQTK